VLTLLSSLFPFSSSPPIPILLGVSPEQVLVRMAFGIDAGNNVAMKLAVRAESADVSDIIHQIIAEA
jgi:hypothetical protein